jgi:anti-anti-sigma factor
LLVTVDLPAGRMLLTGELDTETCAQLASAAPVLVGVAAPVWVLDLATLRFCDASGLRALAAVRDVAARAGAVVVLVGVRPYLRRLLPLVGLGDAVAPLAREVSAPVPDRSRRASAVRRAVRRRTPPVRDPGLVAGGGHDATGRA